jgi:hypothetical protein
MLDSLLVKSAFDKRKFQNEMKLVEYVKLHFKHLEVLNKDSRPLNILINPITHAQSPLSCFEPTTRGLSGCGGKKKLFSK